MKKIIDLNCDLGEHSNKTELSVVTRVLPYISSGNVACGFHAGSATIMRETMDDLVKQCIAIGAHPSFADKQNFGRRELSVSPMVVYNEVLYQIAAAASIAKAAGGKLTHVKPHGALYNMAARQISLSEAIIHAVRDFDKNIVIYGLSGSVLVEYGRKLGMKCAAEVFADRTYREDGSLTPRSQSEALIEDVEVCLDQILKLVRFGFVVSTSGKKVPLEADTICLHGDNRSAPIFAKRLNLELEKIGIQLSPITNKSY